MLIKLKNKLEQAKGKQQLLQQQLDKTKKKKKESKKNLIQSEKAQIIIQEVAKQTQEQIRFHIEDIVSMALATIFPDPYEFKLEFVVKRNKTECEIFFEKDGKKIKPIDASGGGAIDVASFALRIALWNLKFGKKNNTIILDECFHFLSRDLHEKAGELLNKLSKKLGIQFIQVTHSKDLIEQSDRIFEVKFKNGISFIKRGMND